MTKFSKDLLNKNNELVIEKDDFVFFDDFDGKFDCLIKIINQANVKISFLSIDSFDGIINVYLDSKCSVEIYNADFAKNNVNFSTNIYLKNDSKCVFHLASLTGKDSSKNINVCVYHEGENSYSLVDNYGVVKDNGKLVFDGVSYIKNGCVKSKTRQNAKIMVFDKESIGIAKPVLKIDENDIQASHGAVVGKISDEHLFYLMSRGLSEANAKVLITYGYLKPIMAGFDDETKTKIESLIEGRM